MTSRAGLAVCSFDFVLLMHPIIKVESRRGYRDYRRPPSSTREKARPSQPEQLVPDPTMQPDPAFFGGLYMLDPGVAAGQSYTYDELFQPILDGEPNCGSTAATPITIPSPTSSTTSIPRNTPFTREPSQQQRKEPSDLIDIYYKHFHPAHPIVVPWRLARDRPSLLPEPLKAVMRFIASHYIPQSTKVLPEQAVSAIFSQQMPDNGFKVQALLLYCIASFARSEQMQGSLALENAIQIALRIGMNRQSYATTHAPSDPTLQETWRRTFWTLFIIDGLVTAIGGQSESFRLKEVFCDVPLPGEDHDYADLKSSPNPPSLDSFRNRVLLEDNTVYSSLAYCVEATSIMGAIFTLGPDTFTITDPQVEAIDASISNFFLSLPPSKREVVEIDGSVDEPLLMAHMLINWSSILLHRPRSTLTFIRNHYATVCTKREAASMPALAYASHTSKTLRAANAIISLASIQRPLAFCTPCLMCGITTAAVVHLPAYAIAEDNSQAVAIKERLQLGISALGRFSEIWSRAAIAKSQIAAFAREVLTKPNVSVDSTGIGVIPSAKSSSQLQDLELPGSQALLEYNMFMNSDDHWTEIMDQSDSYGSATIGDARSTDGTMSTYATI